MAEQKHKWNFFRLEAQLHATGILFVLFVLLVPMRRGRSNGGRREWLITAGAAISQRTISIRVYTSATLSPLIRTSAPNKESQSARPLRSPSRAGVTRERKRFHHLVLRDWSVLMDSWGRPKERGGTGSEDESLKKSWCRKVVEVKLASRHKGSHTPHEQRWSRPLDAALFSLSPVH